MGPLISIIVPAHNAEATVARALKSALAQTYRPIEIVVVDDGSDDATGEVVSGFGSNLILLITNPSCLGVAAARNAGIRQAKGEFIAFLDADDEWQAEKLARQMALIAGAPSMSFVACAANYITNDNTASRYPDETRQPHGGSDAWKTLLAYSFVCTPSVLARRSTLDEVGLFDDSLVVGEDQDLWIRLARHGEVGFIDEVLVNVHDTPTSLVKQHESAAPELMLRIVRRQLDEVGTGLAPAERRRILACRYAHLGRNAYAAGAAALGAGLVLRAVGLGHAPFTNLTFLLAASPPIRWLKALVGR
jgi:glycosyltransferase involved in cell wall biosynthesis